MTLRRQSDCCMNQGMTLGRVSQPSHPMAKRAVTSTASSRELGKPTSKSLRRRLAAALGAGDLRNHPSRTQLAEYYSKSRCKGARHCQFR